MNQEEIKEIIPHRDPFLLVDEIEEMEPGVRAIGYKNVTGEEGFFRGHFPEYPVMPGVLQVESMAQAATLLTMIAREADVVGKRPAFMGIENCRFRNPVLPGMDLRLEVKLLSVRHGIFKYSGKAFSGEKLMCEADFVAAMV
jgi:3-hydroxyacyl-[acyl-carrier-protein] dehydratase